jgi:hypothetical protein
MEWKDHPVIVAAISAAASMTFYATVLQPIATKEKDNQNAELNQKLGGLVQTLAAAQASEASAVKTSEYLSTRNALLSRDGMFSSDSPYPKGMRAFRVGDTFSIDTLKAAYPGCAVDGSMIDYVSVDCKDSREFYPAATYFLSTVHGKSIIWRISFRYKQVGRESESLVVKLLGEAIGAENVVADNNKLSPGWSVQAKGQRIEVSTVSYDVVWADN